MNHVETGKTHKTLLLVMMILAFSFCRPSGMLSGYPLSRSVSLLAIEHFKGKRMCLEGAFITAYEPWGSQPWGPTSVGSQRCHGLSIFLWMSATLSHSRLKPPVILHLGVFTHCRAPLYGPDAGCEPTWYAFNSWALVCGSSGLADWTKCPLTAASSCYRTLSFHVGSWLPSVQDI